MAYFHKSAACRRGSGEQGSNWCSQHSCRHQLTSLAWKRLSHLPLPPIFICLNCDLSVPVSAPNPRRSQWPRFNSTSSSIMPSATAKARQLRVKFCWYSGRYLLSLPVSSLSPWSHQQSLFLPRSALSSQKEHEFSSFSPGIPRLFSQLNAFDMKYLLP